MSRLRLREVDAEEELDEDEVEVTTCKPWGPTEDEESTDMTLAANIRFPCVLSWYPSSAESDLCPVMALT